MKRVRKICGNWEHFPRPFSENSINKYYLSQPLSASCNWIDITVLCKSAHCKCIQHIFFLILYVFSNIFCLSIRLMYLSFTSCYYFNLTPHILAFFNEYSASSSIAIQLILCSFVIFSNIISLNCLLNLIIAFNRSQFIDFGL